MDAGDRRILTVDGCDYETTYSARVVRMLVERKGPRRTPLYFTYKRARGDHFLGPLFRYLDACGPASLRVLEIGCSFGHITEYLQERPAVKRIVAFDTDTAFVDMVRVKVSESVVAGSTFCSPEPGELPASSGADSVRKLQP